MRRLLLNGLLLALLAGLAWWALKPAHPTLQPKTALVLNFKGALVEQRAALNPRDQALAMATGAEAGTDQTELRDVLAVLEAAAQDPGISHAVLLLDEFAGAGLPTLREAALAMQRFKAAGKPIYAWGSNFNQRQYFLAAHASEVWLHPMGYVLVEGYGRYRSYYKDLFDKLGVTVQPLRVGKYKSAVENYTANAPSPETLEAEGQLWSGLWANYTESVEKARQQPGGSIMAAIDSLPASLQAEQGNPARWALTQKWVDALKTRDELRALMIEKGRADEDGKSFAQVSFEKYLARIKPKTDGDAVGVVVAQGVIIDGPAGGGTVGGLSTAELVRQAREDKQIKALVLRVDSPGGSAFGSELVRHELELTRKAGKPVVVSMANLAASGGYWISMAADRVIADPATITGSIGVVGMLPSAKGAMDKLGVNTGGTTTTWLAAQGDPRRDTDPRFAQLMQTVIDGIYRDFTSLVAKARKRTPEKIHEVAQGRVWSGQDALAHGLVDQLGGLGDAVAAAAELGKLDDKPRLQYIEKPPSKLQRLLQGFGLQAGWPGAQAWADLVAAVVGPRAARDALAALGPPAAAAIDPQMAQDLAGAWQLMQQPARPFDVSAHCLCVVP